MLFEPGPVFTQVMKNRIQTLLDRPFAADPLEGTAYSNPVFDGNRFGIRGERPLSGSDAAP